MRKICYAEFQACHVKSNNADYSKRANLLVVLYEDLYGPQSQEYYNRILDHIGVTRISIPESDSYQGSNYRQKLSNRTRDYLQKFFKPYNDELVKLLKRERNIFVQLEKTSNSWLT